MITSTRSRPARPTAWPLLAGLLISLLLSSHDLPTRTDRVGPRVLGARLQWTTAWVSLKWLGLVPAPSAQMLVRLDPELRTHRAREAARWLAKSAPDQRQRLRWAARLARRDPDSLPLLQLAVRTAVAGRRCDLLRAAVTAAQTLPATSPARRDLANEFATHDALDRWGSVALQAGRKVARTDRLQRAARMLRSAPLQNRHASSTRIRFSACMT
jgi:hypothetical protein